MSWTTPGYPQVRQDHVSGTSGMSNPSQGVGRVPLPPQTWSAIGDLHLVQSAWAATLHHVPDTLIFVMDSEVMPPHAAAGVRGGFPAKAWCDAFSRLDSVLLDSLFPLTAHRVPSPDLPSSHGGSGTAL